MKLAKPEEPQGPKGTPSTAEVVMQVDGKSISEYGTSVDGNTSTCFVSVKAGDTISVTSTNTSGKLDIADLIVDGILRDSKHNIRSSKKFAVEFSRVCHQPKRPGKQSKQALQLFEMQVQPRDTENDELSTDAPSPSKVGDLTVRIYRSDLDDPSESAESGPKLNRGPKYSDYSTWSDLNFKLSPDEPPLSFEIGFINGDKKSIETVRKRIKAEFTEDYKLWAAFTFKLRPLEELRSRGFNVPDRPARCSNSQHESQQAAEMSAAGMTSEVFKPSEFPKAGGKVLQSSMKSISVRTESPRIERAGTSDAQRSTPQVDDTQNTTTGRPRMQVANSPARRNPSGSKGSGGLNQRKPAWAQNRVNANALNTLSSVPDNRFNPLDEPIKLKATPRKAYVEDAIDEDDKYSSHHSMPRPSNVRLPISNPPRSNTALGILTINDFQPAKITQPVPRPISRTSLTSLEDLLDQDNSYNPAIKSTEHRSELQFLRERGRDGGPPVRITNPELNPDDYPKVESVENDKKPDTASGFVTGSGPTYESWQGSGTSQDSDVDSATDSDYDKMERKMPRVTSDKIQSPRLSTRASGLSVLAEGMKVNSQAQTQTPSYRPSTFLDSNVGPSTESELREDTVSLSTPPPSTTKLGKRKVDDISRDLDVVPPTTKFPSRKESAAPALRNTHQREMSGPSRHNSSSGGLNISNDNEHEEVQSPEPNTYEDYIQKKNTFNAAIRSHFSPHFSPLRHKKKEAQDRYQAAFDTRRKEQLKYEQALAHNKDRAEIRELNSNAQKLEQEIADLRARTAALNNDRDAHA